MTTTNQDIQEKLTNLYLELNQAEMDLYNFNPFVIDSGEENWLKDQEKFIESLKEEINQLTSKLI